MGCSLLSSNSTSVRVLVEGSSNENWVRVSELERGLTTWGGEIGTTGITERSPGTRVLWPPL